jgi:hypothetical protein
MAKLKIGELYVIDHSRKGRFVGRVLKDDGEWVTVRVVEGALKYISVAYNYAQKTGGLGTEGDTVQVRKSLAKFRPIRKSSKSKFDVEREEMRRGMI